MPSHPVIRTVVLVLVLSFALTRDAEAALIQVQSQPFGGSFDTIGLTPFDPALGTLDRVGIAINGVLTVTGFAPAFLTGPQQLPTPYQFQVLVDQDFSSNSNAYFEFATPAEYRLSTFVSGGGQAFTFNVPFTFGFQFTAASDFVGFVLPSFSGPTTPPVSIVGNRNDFLETIASPAHFILLTHAVTPTSLGGPVPTLSGWESNGAMTVEYEYTPRAVPEPATWALIAMGTIALRARRRA